MQQDVFRPWNEQSRSPGLHHVVLPVDGERPRFRAEASLQTIRSLRIRGRPLGTPARGRITVPLSRPAGAAGVRWNLSPWPASRRVVGSLRLRRCTENVHHDDGDRRDQTDAGSTNPFAMNSSSPKLRALDQSSSDRVARSDRGINGESGGRLEGCARHSAAAAAQLN